ncbi:MAG: hypothetical protein LBB88_10970 [Planctomycetaceae bacterium]|jgi:hypothetical protein|nr:hypothetical protein [Planctomycetaceae bacterium]
MSNSVDVTSVTPETLAVMLSNSFRQKITEEQIRIIADAGNLLRGDDTINLFQYIAFLIGDF